jgi:hypothetical protein
MSHTAPPDPSDPDLRPGDEAHEGTEEAGEDLCPACGGSGRTDDDATCEVCAGTGRITEGAGGG